MQDIIHFRTLLEGSHPDEYIQTGRRTRSSEIHHIRNYLPGDDPRDILWSRGSVSDTFLTKDRHSSQHPDIVSLSLLSASYDTCTTDASVVSRRDREEEIQRSIEKSIQKKQFRYKKLSTLTEGSDIQRSLIIVLIDLEYDPDPPFPIDTGRNDVIFILLLYPEEYSEQFSLRNDFFASLTLRSRYYDAVAKKIQTLEQIAQERNITLIRMSTEDEPIAFLNHFFKYRYANRYSRTRLTPPVMIHS